MIEVVLRAATFGIGFVLVVVFFQSVLRVAVVNRQRGDPLALMCGSLAYAAIARVASSRHSYDRIQDALAWVFPLYFLLLIATWFLLVQAGFSLMIWSLQAQRNLLQAFISSGSALSTLGFLTPPNLAGQLLAIPEGAFGLGIVVFFFTFIPGYQTTIQIREMKVAWFYARGGVSPTALSFVSWLQRSGKADDMTPVWEDWETWFRLLIESHSWRLSSPWCLRFIGDRAGSSPLRQCWTPHHSGFRLWTSETMPRPIRVMPLASKHLN